MEPSLICPTATYRKVKEAPPSEPIKFGNAQNNKIKNKNKKIPRVFPSRVYWETQARSGH